MKKIKLSVIAVLALILIQNQTNAAPGDLDTTFGSGGKRVITTLGSPVYGPKAAIQPDENKYVIATSVYNPADGYYSQMMVKLNRDGTFDSVLAGGFGVIYEYLTDSAGRRLQTVVLDVKILPSNKILVLSSGRGISPTIYVLTQYNPNGTIDTSFGTRGRIFISAFAPKFVEIKPDGKIIVAGHDFSGTVRDLAVAQFNPNGLYDSTFDGDGIAKVDLYSRPDCAPGCSAVDSLYDLKIQPDGKIVVLGRSRGTDGKDYVGIARLIKNGQLDWYFDNDGKTAWVDYPTASLSLSMVIQSDGSMVVCESVIAGGGYYVPKLVKLSAFGAYVDSQNALPTYSYNIVIAKQSDDKIVEISPINSEPNKDFGTARYKSDLYSDVSWNLGDFLATDFTPAGSISFRSDIPTDIVIDSFNKPLIVGVTYEPSGSTLPARLAIVRLLPD
jgi:uncharacterized delta-60 repeat protein